MAYSKNRIVPFFSKTNSAVIGPETPNSTASSSTQPVESSRKYEQRALLSFVNNGLTNVLEFRRNSLIIDSVKFQKSFRSPNRPIDNAKASMWSDSRHEALQHQRRYRPFCAEERWWETTHCPYSAQAQLSAASHQVLTSLLRCY